MAEKFRRQLKAANERVTRKDPVRIHASGVRMSSGTVAMQPSRAFTLSVIDIVYLVGVLALVALVALLARGVERL